MVPWSPETGDPQVYKRGLTKKNAKSNDCKNGEGKSGLLR